MFGSVPQAALCFDPVVLALLLLGVLFGLGGLAASRLPKVVVFLQLAGEGQRRDCLFAFVDGLLRMWRENDFWDVAKVGLDE